MIILEMKKATKIINNGSSEQKVLLNNVNLSINEGDFITVLGGNGAGKSTLFNTISGTLPLTSGKVFIHDLDVSQHTEERRAQFISRVFQILT